MGHASKTLSGNCVESALSIVGIGFLLGVKHAFDADHLVAVSTLVTEHRSLRAAARIGILWRLGHTASLLAAGLLVITIRRPIPETVAQLCELAVATMIVFLGVRLLLRLRQPHARL